MNENRSRATSFKDLRSLRITINISSKLNFLINPSKKKNPNYYSNSIDRRTNWMKRKRKRKRKVNSITKKHSSMNQWERERELTWPPTTAMAGRESQRVGNALASPWSPRAVQALWILLTSEIKFSIYLRSEYRWLSGNGVDQIQIRLIWRPEIEGDKREIWESDAPTSRER